jgi:hypothetical protein
MFRVEEKTKEATVKQEKAPALMYVFVCVCVYISSYQSVGLSIDCESVLVY